MAVGMTWPGLSGWRRGRGALGGLGRVLTVVVLATPLTGWGLARPDLGSLDLRFGVGGKAITDFGLESGAGAVVVQADGRLVVGGSAVVDLARRDDFALARYRRNGRLDRSFGEGGKVTTDFGEGSDGVAAVAIQSDGKIVAAGGASTGPEGNEVDFALARYQRNGTLDVGFGDGGTVTTDFAGGLDRVHALVVQPDGKLVAAGWASTTPERGFDDIGLARYNPDGSLDPTFGNGGKVTTDFDLESDTAADLILQRDGKLVVAREDFGLVRYNPDGSLDLAFGDGGTVLTDFGYLGQQGLALAVQRDGKLVVAGRVDGVPVGGFALARYHPDGTLDPTFGRQGLVIAGFGDNVDHANALVVQPDGRLVAAGYPGLIRFDPDGTLDTTFGDEGKVPSDIATADLVMQGDRRIVAVGTAVTEHDDGSVDINFGLARYHIGRHDPIEAVRVSSRAGG